MTYIRILGLASCALAALTGAMAWFPRYTEWTYIGGNSYALIDFVVYFWIAAIGGVLSVFLLPSKSTWKWAVPTATALLLIPAVPAVMTLTMALVVFHGLPH